MIDGYGSIAKFVKKRPFSEVDRITLADDMFFWSKLWRTRFLLDNDIRCPEGMYSEDNFVQWKALLCRPRLALLPEMMYHYRVNLTSTMRGTENKAAWDLPKIYDLIKKMLIETDNYHGEWKEIFLQKKLKALRAPYVHVASHRKAEYLRMVREAIGQDETEYLIHNKTLKRQIAVFYRALLGSRCAAIENAAWLTLRGFNARCNALRYKLKRAA
ncbi:hypothetical protein FACS189443_7280 [Planctomycetales bacterium]|nr:hypothetical protein FACS189443_7280 [Planctomycetales bacterium]